MMEAKRMKKVAQQGDVVIKKVTGIDTATLKRLDHLVLAEGEVTGHAHRVVGGAATLYEDKGGGMVLDVTKEATVTHEEHGHITLAPGKYKVGRIKEYDHFAEEAKQVRD